MVSYKKKMDKTDEIQQQEEQIADDWENSISELQISQIVKRQKEIQQRQNEEKQLATEMITNNSLELKNPKKYFKLFLSIKSIIERQSWKKNINKFQLNNLLFKLIYTCISKLYILTKSF